MKHLMMFCLVALLASSCTQDALVPTLDPLEDSTLGLSNSQSETNTDPFVSSPQDFSAAVEGDHLIFAGLNQAIDVNYFLNGEEVSEGTFNVNDDNLHIVLRIEEASNKEGSVLVFNYNAFFSEDEYFEWGQNNQILLEAAHSITDKFADIAADMGFDETYDAFGKIPSDYYDQMKSAYFNAVETWNIPANPSLSLLFQDIKDNPTGIQVKEFGSPVLPNGWYEEVSSFSKTSDKLPTIIFRNTLFRDAMNPVISIEPSVKIDFDRSLLHLNDRAKSWF